MAPKGEPAASAPILARRAGKEASTPSSKWVPKDLRDYDVAVPGGKWEGFFGNTLSQIPLLNRLNWLHVPLLVLTPIIGIYGALTWEFNMKTFAFAVFWYFVTGLGITAGYHRLFAHKGYKGTALARFLLLLAGAGAVEGSAKWWSRDHRAHHRFVDTDKDPYSAAKGFWYSHIGWMLVKQDKSKIGSREINIQDLLDDYLVVWQHKWYLPIAAFMALVLPTLICGLAWGDYYGGYFIAGVARLVFVHHSTFFVNSLAHWTGEATFADAHTARNSIITAVLTLGEGYHNFHHEFPQDYRNGVKWWQYDPTKMLIWGMSLIGLTYDLIETPAGEILKGELQMRQKVLQKEKETPEWGPDPELLPSMSWKEFKDSVATGKKKWVVMKEDPVEGGFGSSSSTKNQPALRWFVLDVAPLMDPKDYAMLHPGGASLLNGFVGTDITLHFNQHKDEKSGLGYYKHSNAAHNLAVGMRIAKLSDAPPKAETKTK